jgi:hypothetical protein
MHNVMMLWKESSMPNLLLDKMNLIAEDKKFLKGTLLSHRSYCFVNNQTLNGMLFLEFEKESKQTSKLPSLKLQGKKTFCFNLLQMMIHLIVKRICTLTMTQIPTRFLQPMTILSLNLLQYGMTTNLSLLQTWQWLHTCALQTLTLSSIARSSPI